MYIYICIYEYMYIYIYIIIYIYIRFPKSCCFLHEVLSPVFKPFLGLRTQTRAVPSAEALAAWEQ